MVYQLFLDPPKFPLKRGTLTLVPPFLRGVRGDHEVPKITIQNFSNTLSHPKSDRTPPHSQKAIALLTSPKAIALLTSPKAIPTERFAIALPHSQKAIPTERFAIALPHPQTAIALSHSQTSDIFGIIRTLV